MQSSAKQNSWIIILPVAAVAAVYVFCFFLPGRKAIADLRDQIHAKQDYVLDAEKSARALRTGRQELEKTEAYVSSCRRRAPTEKDLGNTLAMIHEAANKAKVKITRFDPQSPVVYERLRRVPVVVGLVGQFEQIQAFVRNLEEMPTSIWVGTVKLDLDAKSGMDVVGEVNLGIFVDNSDNSGYAVCSR